jgi:hypothetical protein
MTWLPFLIIRQFALPMPRFRDVLMADCGIVQKDEIVIVHSHCGRVRLKREREIGLLSDCFDWLRTPKLGNPQEGFL